MLPRFSTMSKHQIISANDGKDIDCESIQTGVLVETETFKRCIDAAFTEFTEKQINYKQINYQARLLWQQQFEAQCQQLREQAQARQEACARQLNVGPRATQLTE